MPTMSVSPHCKSALFRPPLSRSRWEGVPATQGHCNSAQGRVSHCYMCVVTFPRPHNPHRLCAGSVMSYVSCLPLPQEYCMELCPSSGFNSGLLLALFTHLRVPPTSPARQSFSPAATSICCLGVSANPSLLWREQALLLDWVSPYPPVIWPDPSVTVRQLYNLQSDLPDN